MGSSPLASIGRLISLDDPAATAPELVGAKAATLAQARRDGLPVLPGYVVPAAEGAPALRAGCAALRAPGRKSARRAVFSVPVRRELISELGWAVGQLGGRAIVRSSSGLEADPRWSGAFSSIREIGVDDVAAAARSCWASAFAPDPLDRLEQCGLEPAQLGLSLLVQPDLTPDFGGLARTRGSGTDISWTSGHPGALLAGVTEGQSVRVTARRRCRLRPPGSAPRSSGRSPGWLRRSTPFSGMRSSNGPGRRRCPPAPVRSRASGWPGERETGRRTGRWAGPGGGHGLVAGDAVGALQYVSPGQAASGPAGTSWCAPSRSRRSRRCCSARGEMSASQGRPTVTWPAWPVRSVCRCSSGCSCGRRSVRWTRSVRGGWLGAISGSGPSWP